MSPDRTSRRREPRPKPRQDQRDRGTDGTGRPGGGGGGGAGRGGGGDVPRMNLEDFQKVLSSVIGPGVSVGCVERFFHEVRRTR